jgi:hypothetical protein
MSAKCSGTGKKGGPCPNPPVKNGLCEFHLKKRSSSQPPPSSSSQSKPNKRAHDDLNPKQKPTHHVNPLNHTFLIDGAYYYTPFPKLNTKHAPPSEHQSWTKNLQEFQKKYDIPGKTRSEIASNMALAPIDILAEIITMEKMPIDLKHVNADTEEIRSALVIQMLDQIEKPIKQLTPFEMNKLNVQVTMDQYEKSAEDLRDRISILLLKPDGSDVVEFLGETVQTWLQDPMDRSGYFPIIDSKLPINYARQLYFLFSDFEHLFQLKVGLEKVKTGEKHVTLRVSNYVKVDDWTSLFNFVLFRNCQVEVCR